MGRAPPTIPMGARGRGTHRKPSPHNKAGANAASGGAYERSVHHAHFARSSRRVCDSCRRDRRERLLHHHGHLQVRSFEGGRTRTEDGEPDGNRELDMAGGHPDDTWQLASNGDLFQGRPVCSRYEVFSGDVTGAWLRRTRQHPSPLDNT